MLYLYGNGLARELPCYITAVNLLEIDLSSNKLNRQHDRRLQDRQEIDQFSYILQRVQRDHPYNNWNFAEPQLHPAV